MLGADSDNMLLLA